MYILFSKFVVGFEIPEFCYISPLEPTFIDVLIEYRQLYFILYFIIQLNNLFYGAIFVYLIL